VNWPLVEIKKVARIVGGATPKSGVSEYWGGQIAWATPKDLADLDGKEIVDTPRKITDRGLQSCAAEQLPAGSVLFSSRAPIGHIAINCAPMATNQGFKSFVPGPNLDASFLYWWLDANREQLQAMGNGATFKEVSKAVVERIVLPLPPLPEQRRIAAILDQADTLRRLRRQTLSRLSDLGRAIFFEMFGDAATNPQDWPIVKLGDVCGVGSSKRVFVSEFTESGVPFYRGTEVGQLGAGKTISPELFIDRDHYESLIRESGRPAVGDLLLPSICHDGRIWLVDDDLPFYFKDGRVLWIKSAQANIDGEYLRRHLQDLFLRDYNKIASGTTFAELKIVNLKGLQILYPPLALQKQFARRMSSLEGARKNMLNATDKSEALFNSLQHRAFRGEL